MNDRRAWPAVSIVIPTHDGKGLLAACLDSVRRLDYPRHRLETIVVDNISSDGTAPWLRRRYPWVRVLRNAENSYCGANNMGIRRAKGAYVAFLNNDAVVDKAWLKGLVARAETDERIAGVTGKVLFPDGRINGAGHQHLKPFYVRDRGFGERDRGQYDSVSELDSISLCAALFRRASLIDAGLLDEDFVMYYEDVELCHRLRRKGWKLLYEPGSVVRHRWNATSGRLGIDYFFNNRNRLLFVAKHFPERLPRHVLDSRFYKHGRYRHKCIEYLYAVVPEALAKLRKSVSGGRARRIGGRVLRGLAAVYDPETLRRLRLRWEVMLGDRRIRVGVYDHALHFVGGGQKYVLTMAKILSERMDIEYLSNYPVSARRLSRWHGMDVDFPIRVIRLPAYAGQDRRAIDPGLVRRASDNPFDAVSARSSRYDFFINANMLSRVRPRASTSVFICHFPDQDKDEAWYADRYDVVVNNSEYCAHWMRAKWGMSPDLTVFPPIDMNGARAAKENIILSVSRFEESGSKKQREMVLAFARLCGRHPEVARRWRLVLCGGHLPGEDYLRKVAATHLLCGARLPVEIRANVGAGELRRLYGSAKIFWHLCGLGETEPQRIEHFGMTTVEAMQNSCVPVAFNGGGQREIVESGRSGYLVDTSAALERATLRLIRHPRLLRRLAGAARRRSRAFSVGVFRKAVVELFRRLETEYRAPPRPTVEQVAHGRLLERLRRDARIAPRAVPGTPAPAVPAAVV